LLLLVVVLGPLLTNWQPACLSYHVVEGEMFNSICGEYKYASY
jgi:hypothetical protein